MLFPDKNPISFQLFLVLEVSSQAVQGALWGGGSLGMSPQGLVLVQEQSLSSTGPFPNLPHPQSMGSFVVSVSCMGTWSWIHSKSWSIHTKEPTAPARAVLACRCCVPWMDPYLQP